MTTNELVVNISKKNYFNLSPYYKAFTIICSIIVKRSPMQWVDNLKKIVKLMWTQTKNNRERQRKFKEGYIQKWMW